MTVADHDVRHRPKADIADQRWLRCTNPPGNIRVGAWGDFQMISELIELSAVIGDIYDAAIDPSLWQQALKAFVLMSGLVGGPLMARIQRRSAAKPFICLTTFLRTPNFISKIPADESNVSGSDVHRRGCCGRNRRHNAEIGGRETDFTRNGLPQGIVDALSVNLEGRYSQLLNKRSHGHRSHQNNAPPFGSACTAFTARSRDRKVFDQKTATENALTQTLDHVEAAVFSSARTEQLPSPTILQRRCSSTPSS